MFRRVVVFGKFRQEGNFGEFRSEQHHLSPESDVTGRCGQGLWYRVKIPRVYFRVESLLEGVGHHEGFGLRV